MGQKEAYQRFQDREHQEAEKRIVELMTDGLSTWANSAMPVLANSLSLNQVEELCAPLAQLAFDSMRALRPRERFRVCIYRLDYREQEGGERELVNATLEAFGPHTGRNGASSRTSFTAETRNGRNTLDAIWNGKSILCADISTDERYKEEGKEYAYRSFIAVPMDTDGEIRGMITCDAQTPGVFDARYEALLRLPAQMLGWILGSPDVADSKILSARRSLANKLGERGEFDVE